MPSSARGRSSRVTQQKDPLTIVFALLVYPIFLCLYTILHLVYDCLLKLVANIQWQRYIYSQTRQRPRQLLQSWRSGFGVGAAGANTAEQSSQERLLKRGNIVRTKGRLVTIDNKDGAPASTKKQRALVPRHLALVMASKPVQTRVLLYRALVAAAFGREASAGYKQEAQQDMREKDQVKYTLDSVNTLLRCCACAGIEEVSLYDEAGRIKRTLKGKQKWILEWPMNGEWQAADLAADLDDEQRKSTPCSSDSPSSSPATTPRSYSSASDSVPSSYTTTSSGDLADVCEQRFISKQDALPPQLQLTACLHSPSYDGEALTEEPASIGYMHKGNAYQVNIRVNLLDAEDAQNAIARAASRIAESPDMLKTVEVKTIDTVLRGEYTNHFSSRHDVLTCLSVSYSSIRLSQRTGSAHHTWWQSTAKDAAWLSILAGPTL